MNPQSPQSMSLTITTWIFLVLVCAVLWVLLILGLGALAHITMWLLCYGWNFF